MKYIEQDKEAVLRAMRAMDEEEEVKQDGKPMPAKPAKGGPGKRKIRYRPAIDDIDALHKLTRAQVVAGTQGTIDVMRRKQRH